MRNIKYRVYIKRLKLMLNVERINFDVGTVEVDASYGNGDLSEYGLDEIELMQSIGFKDKNGKEIYEGDIVEVIDHWYTNEYPEIAKFTGVVEYGSGSFYVRMDETYSNYRLMDLEMRVVGDIYENQELLERGIINESN